MTSEHVGGDSTYNLLQTSLQCAVPLWIFRLKEKSWETIIARREYVVDMIASHGDNILFRSKKAGETAAAFNALAEALAIMSFVPGGVQSFGCRWEATHPQLRPEAMKLASILEAIQRLDPSQAQAFKKKMGARLPVEYRA